MDFSCFIESFGTGFRSMRNEKNIVADEPEYHTKPSFCRELLCSITSNENIVLFKNADKDGTPRTLATFEAFYRKSQRRTLHSIAVCLIERNAIDKEKFQLFMRGYVNGFSKEALLNNFKPYLPDITLESLFRDITDQFVKIIQDAANTPDKRKNSSTDKPGELQDSLELNESDTLTSPREKVERLLQKLEKRAKTLYADFLRFSAVYDTATPDERKQNDETIRNDHRAFTTLNDKLYEYIEDYPDFQQLIDLHSTGDCWVLSFFRPWDQSGTLPMPEGMMDYYQQLMNAAKEALPAYFEHNAL